MKKLVLKNAKAISGEVLSRSQLKKVLGGNQEGTGSSNGCILGLISCTCDDGRHYCVSSVNSCITFCTPV